MKLKEILNDRYRTKRKNYILETDEYWCVIKGSYIREASDEIIKAYEEFKKGNVDWDNVVRKIDRLYKMTEVNEWDYLDSYKEDLNIIEAYADGEKIV